MNKNILMITSGLKNATALAAKTRGPLLFPWNLDKREEETEDNTKGKKNSSGKTTHEQ